MPRHHSLEEYLIVYLDGARLRGDSKAPMFSTIGRGTSKLTRTGLPQANAYAMIRRRRPAPQPSSATTASERRESPRISRTAAPWKRRRRWQIIPQRGRCSSMIASATS
jgi:hypothetical protein